MKMKCTALLLTAIMCMAGAVSCGTVENAGESSAELKISTTTASTEDVTTSAETGTATDEGATTEAAETTETTAETAAETTAAAEAAAAAPTEAPADNSAAANNEAPAQQQEQPQQNNETPADNGSEPDKKNVQFSTDDLLKNGAETVAALGNPDSTSISPSCTNNGCDIKEYQYPDLEMQCYIDGGVEYICYVKIKGGDYSTTKGIKVGSSRADVEAAYGAGEEMSGMVVYADGNKEMDITYNGDTVASIEFYTPV